MKLLFIGVDGASYRVIKRLKEKNAISFLNDSDFKGKTLLSFTTKGYAVPHTGPAWSTIYTGVKPENHGIESGGWLNEHKKYNDLKVKTIWEILDENSISTGLFSLPFTHPSPELQNGWSVSGFPRPSDGSKSFYPANLPKYVEDMEVDLLSGERPGELRKIFDRNRLLEIEKKKAKKFIKLVEDRPVEIGAMGITSLDRANHILCQKKSKLKSIIYRALGKMDPTNKFPQVYASLIERFDGSDPIEGDLFEIYIKTFEIIQKVILSLNSENVLICSDHGFVKYGDVRYPSRHDIFGYIGAKGEISKNFKSKVDLRHITPMILDLFNIDRKKIGEKIDRYPYEYSKSAQQEIKERLKSLGYI